MGKPVVHFEVLGKDGEGLRRFYGALFDWGFETDDQLGYGVLAREENLGPDGVGIGGGVGQAPEGSEGHLTFYVAVDDVEQTLAKAEGLGATRVMGPEEIMPGLVLGMLLDPEGHLIGVLRGEM